MQLACEKSLGQSNVTSVSAVLKLRRSANKLRLVLSTTTQLHFGPANLDPTVKLH